MLDEGRALVPEAAGVGHFERVLYLKKVLPLLPAAQLGMVAEHMRERVFARGEVLLREGELAEAIFFVMQGRVHVSRGGRVMGHAGPGSAVGALGLFAGEPTTIGVEAETDIAVLVLSADAVREILEDQFPVLLYIMRNTCSQLIELILRSPGAAWTLPAAGPEPASDRELDLVERIFFMRRSPAFRRSSIEALSDLSRGFTEVRYAPGTVLWPEGEPSGWFSLIVTGSIRATPSRGRPFDMIPGAPAGSLESLAGVPRWYEARALTPTRALNGNMQGFIDVFEDNIGMALDYLAVISKWLMDGFEKALDGQDKELLRLYGCEDAEAHEG